MSTSVTLPNMSTLPVRMSNLPVDKRGWVVPWFVEWVNGQPEFRAMDQDKWVRAVRERLCWVCGGRLGVHVTFVAGPMCGINRTTSEPPCHRDCAVWSAQNCPFLTNPRAVRREDEQINNQSLRDKAAGMALSRNPGVTMLWHARGYEVFNDGNDKPLIMMGEPEFVEWYAHGRTATLKEVQDSIDSGLPALEAMANMQPGSVQQLERAIQRFQKYLPPV